MRTYAPNDTASVLDGLLAEPSMARGVVHHAVLPAREADVRRFPGLARSADRGRPGAARDRATVRAPGRGHGAGPRRSGLRRGHADRIGQDPLLRAADPPGDRRRSGRARAPPLPDQGARPGPGHRVRRARPCGRAPRVGRDLRRRHAGTHPVGHPRRRPGGGHQPGHAPLGDPAPSHQVVPAVRAAPLHRHRRAAHLPRRVRRARRERAPAPPADLRPLRQPSGDRLLLGHDREPGRAGRGADRTAGRGPDPERGARRRAPRPPRGPAAARPRQRRPRLGHHPRASAGHSPSSAPGARPSCSAGPGSPSSCC